MEHESPSPFDSMTYIRELEEENKRLQQQVETLEEKTQELQRENKRLADEARSTSSHLKRLAAQYTVSAQLTRKDWISQDEIEKLKKTNQQLQKEIQILVTATLNPLNAELSTLKKLTNSIKKYAWHTGLFGGLKLQRHKDHSHYKVTGTAAKILTTLRTIKKELNSGTIKSSQTLQDKINNILSTTLDKVSDENYKKTLNKAWTFGFFGGLTTKDSVQQYRDIFVKLKKLTSP